MTAQELDVRSMLAYELSIPELKFLLELERSETHIPPPPKLVGVYKTWLRSHSAQVPYPAPASAIAGGLFTAALRDMRTQHRALVDLVLADMDCAGVDAVTSAAASRAVQLSGSDARARGPRISVKVLPAAQDDQTVFISGEAALSYHSELLSALSENLPPGPPEQRVIDLTKDDVVCQHCEPHIDSELFSKFLLFTVYGSVSNPGATLAAVAEDVATEQKEFYTKKSNSFRALLSCMRARRVAREAEVASAAAAAAEAATAAAEREYQAELLALQLRHKRRCALAAAEAERQKRAGFAAVAAFFDAEERRCVEMIDRVCDAEGSVLSARSLSLESALAPIIGDGTDLQRLLAAATALGATDMARLVRQRLANQMSQQGFDFSSLTMLSTCKHLHAHHCELLASLPAQTLRSLHAQPRPPLRAAAITHELTARRRAAAELYKSWEPVLLTSLLAAVRGGAEEQTSSPAGTGTSDSGYSDHEGNPTLTPLETALIACEDAATGTLTTDANRDRVIGGVRLSSIVFVDALEEAASNAKSGSAVVFKCTSDAASDECVVDASFPLPGKSACNEIQKRVQRRGAGSYRGISTVIALCDGTSIEAPPPQFTDISPELLPTARVLFSPTTHTFYSNQALEYLLINTAGNVVNITKPLYFEVDVLALPATGAELLIGVTGAQYTSTSDLPLFAAVRGRAAAKPGGAALASLVSSAGTLMSLDGAVTLTPVQSDGGPPLSSRACRVLAAGRCVGVSVSVHPRAAVTFFVDGEQVAVSVFPTDDAVRGVTVTPAIVMYASSQTRRVGCRVRSEPPFAYQRE